MRLEFFIACLPPKTTAQQKRLAFVGGKPRFFKNKAGAEAESDFLTLLLPHRPDAPLKSPCSLHVNVTWPWRSAEPKKNRANGAMRHTTKPDCSNWIKQFEDCLVKLRFIEDDAGISDLSVSKKWGDEPGIYVILDED